MNIFVTGGTGLIGNELIHELLQKGYAVTVLTRNAQSVKNAWKKQVKLVEADSVIPGRWMEEINLHEGIVNLAGENIFTKRWTSKRKKQLLDSRVKTTTNLVKAVKNAKTPPKFFISASGADYYPSSSEIEYTEEFKGDSSFLSLLCEEWEKPVHELVETRYIIFRFGVSFSKTGKSAERMFFPHKLFLGGYIGSGKQWMSWIHIEDFTGLIVWAIEEPIESGIYNAAAPDPLPSKTIAKLGGKILGRPTWTWVPGFVLKLILGERATMLLEGRKISPRKVIQQGYEFKFPSLEEALEDVLA
ncbi:MAG: TIGR01777 family oxidoreductase [Candidatus Kariarchaeaceae archaeon]|jgi:uncharacterized protein (TIGR01777 family)